jgi:hypothetical protein
LRAESRFAVPPAFTAWNSAAERAFVKPAAWTTASTPPRRRQALRLVTSPSASSVSNPQEGAVARAPDEDAHRMLLERELLRDVGAEEAAGAGDQYSHDVSGFSYSR